jgi:hypothetical protein
VQVLSRVFRRTFLRALQQAATKGPLHFRGTCQSLAAPPTWRRFIAGLRQTEWVVYAKPPLAGPQPVLRYLARYTHRVAITNRRLLACADGHVTFRWQDYKRSNRPCTMTLGAVEFLRRFLLHILPRGFRRVRYYGLFDNGVRKGKLPLCRWLLGHALWRPADVSSTLGTARPASGPPLSSDVCPVCHHGRMQVQEAWRPIRVAWGASDLEVVCDTS